MIIYDLKCSAGHEFEGWFSNSEDYQQQQQQHMLSCPLCGAASVEKLPTASRVNTLPSCKASPQDTEPDRGVVQQLLHQLHDYVDQNFEDVGAQFAEEARRMHYGETEERNIRGIATPDEAQGLNEEGITAISLPGRPNDKNKLN